MTRFGLRILVDHEIRLPHRNTQAFSLPEREMMDAVMRAHRFPIARHDQAWIIRDALLYQKITIIPCYEAKVLALRALSDWYP